MQDAVARKSGAGAAGSGFFTRIESLRGVAAFMVAVFHSIHLLPVDGVERLYARTAFELEGIHTAVARLWMAVFNGGAAVSLFFVISGFVLRLALERDTRAAPDVVTSFAARRFFRIYPALAANLVAMFVALWATHLLWPAAVHEAPTPGDLLENLVLLAPSTNGATWSLQVEFLAVPFVLAGHFIAKRFGARGLLVFVAFLLAAVFERWLLFRVGLIANHMFMFGFGVLVADFAPRLAAKLTRRSAGGLLALGVALLLGARLVVRYYSKWSLLLEGVGGALVVALVAFGPTLRPIAWLDSQRVRALGRISYSFYLWHPVFLMAFAGPAVIALTPPAVLAAWPLACALLIAVLSIPPTWFAAKLSYAWVEQGAIGFGRRQEKRLLAAVAR